MTRERPILFSAPMVRAVLAGRKTVTRRVVKPQPEDAHTEGAERQVAGPTCVDLAPGTQFFRWLERGGVSGGFRCPYGQPGDRLWVRETWCQQADIVHGHLIEGKAHYAADGYEVRHRSPWRPSIHMPRWASRITLEVVDVRVERLQDITEDDARAEGIAEVTFVPDLWDSLNAERAPWKSNPWVWRVAFRRITYERIDDDARAEAAENARLRAVIRAIEEERLP